LVSRLDIAQDDQFQLKVFTVWQLC